MPYGRPPPPSTGTTFTASATGSYSVSVVWVRAADSNGVSGNGTGRWNAYSSSGGTLTP